VNQLEQKAYDSKVILIIGDWKNLKNRPIRIRKNIKKKTLNCLEETVRNVEILTFDELFERACFITEGKKEADFIIEDDDLPF
jgi:hypothetical protein